MLVEKYSISQIAGRGRLIYSLQQPQREGLKVGVGSNLPFENDACPLLGPVQEINKTRMPRIGTTLYDL